MTSPTKGVRDLLCGLPVPVRSTSSREMRSISGTEPRTSLRDVGGPSEAAGAQDSVTGMLCIPRGRIHPTRKPATSESPAPTADCTLIGGGYAIQTVGGDPHASSAPSPPSESRMISGPRASRCLTARTKAARRLNRSPSSSSTSCRFGLISQGRAERPRCRASPDASRTTGTLRRRNARIHRW